MQATPRRLNAAPKRAADKGRAQRTDSEFLVRLGQRVREARQRRGISRKVLAEFANVSERYLAHLEAGDGNASIVFLRQVATGLQARLVDLIDDNDVSSAYRSISRFLGAMPPERLDDVLQRLIKDFGAEESVRRKRIALIGLRGAGKSTLGSALAKEMRRPFVELDREIERAAGMGLAEIFLLYGQSGYRSLERRCLERIIHNQAELVLSVGGGVVSEGESFQLLLSNCFTLWIKASPEEHMSRVVAQGDMRPIKGHKQAMVDLKNILAAREPLYAQADKAVDTSGQSIEKSLAAVRKAIAAPST